MFPWFEQHGAEQCGRPQSAVAEAGRYGTAAADLGALHHLDRRQDPDDGQQRQHRVRDRAGRGRLLWPRVVGKESGYVASVWDLNTATEVGSVSTDVTGTSVLIGAIVPIPIITPVRSKACDRLGDQLRTFLIGDGAGPSPTPPAVSVGSTGSR